MSQLFPRLTDKVLRIGLGVVGLMALGGGAIAAYMLHPEQVDTGYTPRQPIAYSHKLHAGDLGIDCLYCHVSVDKAAFAAVPSTETCMNCHDRVKPQHPEIIKIRESYATGAPIPWVKIHKLPDYAYFNHQAHVTSGVSCVSCHGRIDQMIEVKQVEPLSMAWCLNCHRNPAANIRPAELVTKLSWKPDRDPAEIGREIIAAKNINPPVTCSGCHR
ncbi:MAG TPA: cytochrome C [Solibacterales bacterium]|nr:cytochrome C [Bryobacterales bacterium]